MELSAEARAEIAAAIAIARSDGLHIHKTYPAFLAAQAEEEKGKEDKPTDGQPPPVKDPPADDYEEIAGLWGTRKVKKAKADDKAAG